MIYLVMQPIKSDATLKDYQKYIAEMVEERGFTDETIPEIFMYLSEEVGEMAKAARQATKLHTDSNSKKFELAHEIADVFIYLVDIANHFDIDMESAFRDKEEINNKRIWNKKGE
jgi:NTP pyrophosphatase (non-canonical NTP hydrolase)